MSEMVERVQKAIAVALGFDLSTLYENEAEWFADLAQRHQINTPYRSEFADAARAAIKALREPTGAMIDKAQALDRYPFGSSTPTGTADDEDKWRAMIDAAVGEAND